MNENGFEVVRPWSQRDPYPHLNLRATGAYLNRPAQLALGEPSRVVLSVHRERRTLRIRPAKACERLASYKLSRAIGFSGGGLRRLFQLDGPARIPLELDGDALVGVVPEQVAE